MIRVARENFHVFSVVFVLSGLCIASVPILAQADIFIRQGESQEAEEGKKRGFFYFLRGDKSKEEQKSEGYTYKSRTVKKQHGRYFAPPKVDPVLMSSKGRGPQTVMELLDVAAAHRAPKIKHMLQLSIEKQKISAMKMNKFLAQSQKYAMHEVEERPEDVEFRKYMEENKDTYFDVPSTVKENSSQEKKTTKRKLKPFSDKKNGMSKPKRVFNRLQ